MGEPPNPPPQASFAGFVQRALAAIQAEVPRIHDGLTRAMSGWTTLLVVDGEPALVGARGATEIAVAPRREAADVVCTTTTRTILDLLGGRETLLDAVLAGRLELTGGVDALLVWHDVLALFLQGAVRARAFEGLLGEFRGRLGRRQERA